LKPIPGEHIDDACEVIEVPLQKLDSLITQLEHGWQVQDFNVLYVNIEGAELQALRRAEETLPHMDFVFTEVNLASHYEGNPTAEELEEFLAERGFALKWRCGGFVPDTGYLAFTRS